MQRYLTIAKYRTTSRDDQDSFTFKQVWSPKESQIVSRCIGKAEKDATLVGAWSCNFLDGSSRPKQCYGEFGQREEVIHSMISSARSVYGITDNTKLTVKEKKRIDREAQRSKTAKKETVVASKPRVRIKTPKHAEPFKPEYSVYYAKDVGDE